MIYSPPTTRKPGASPPKKSAFKGSAKDQATRLTRQPDPNQGIRKDGLGIKRKPTARDKSKWGRPVGAKREHIGRHKSKWGRPVGFDRKRYMRRQHQRSDRRRSFHREHREMRHRRDFPRNMHGNFRRSSMRHADRSSHGNQRRR